MMRARPVKPRARRNALIVASVPDDTARTISMDGYAARIVSANSTSISVVAPSVVTDDLLLVVRVGPNPPLDRGVRLRELLVDDRLEIVGGHRAGEIAAVDEERGRGVDAELLQLRLLVLDLLRARARDVVLIAREVELRFDGELVDRGVREVAHVERLGPDQLGERAELALMVRRARRERRVQRGRRVDDHRLVDHAQIAAVLLAQIVDGV